MQYSNEAVALIESVLSESERWQYRKADIDEEKLEQEIDKLEDERAKERKKVEDYGKDPSRFNEILDEIRKKRETLESLRDNKRTILNPSRAGIDEFNNKQKSKNSDTRHFILSTKTNAINKPPKNKALHNRINERTKKYDTTAKHEAAMILIEALNTLLNE